MAEMNLITDDVTWWANVWLWVMIIGGAAFFCILMYSVITGASDIKQLFAALKQAEEDAEQAQQPGAVQDADEAAAARATESDLDARTRR